MLEVSAWVLFIVPWKVFAGMAWIEMGFVVANMWMVIVAAVLINALGYLAFAARWWWLRAVRIIGVAPNHVTFAARKEGYAQELATLNGADAIRKWWVG